MQVSSSRSLVLFSCWRLNESFSTKPRCALALNSIDSTPALVLFIIIDLACHGVLPCPPLFYLHQQPITYKYHTEVSLWLVMG